MPEVIHRRGMNCRGFIQTSAASFLGLLLSNTAKVFARTPKKVLVFGGTDFLGPAVVDALMADGHTVTIFNRGVTNAELFSHVEKLRDQGLYRVSSAKAYAAGWQTRPFEETAFDCLSDFYSGQSQRPNYLTAAREKEVLEAWKKRTSLNRAHEPAYA
jgi:hypothetical protein